MPIYSLGLMRSPWDMHTGEYLWYLWLCNPLILMKSISIKGSAKPKVLTCDSTRLAVSGHFIDVV